MTASKIVTEMTRDNWFEKCEKWWLMTYKEKKIKYNTVIIVQYKIEEDVTFVVQYQ